MLQCYSLTTTDDDDYPGLLLPLCFCSDSFSFYFTLLWYETNDMVRKEMLSTRF